MDPLTGWVQIRPYNQETWSYIRARFRCPVLLLSATMEEKSLQRIAGKMGCKFDVSQKIITNFPVNLDIPRDEIMVLYQSADRKNIYEQRRFSTKSIDVRSVLKSKESPK